MLPIWVIAAFFLLAMWVVIDMFGKPRGSRSDGFALGALLHLLATAGFIHNIFGEIVPLNQLFGMILVSAIFLGLIFGLTAYTIADALLRFYPEKKKDGRS